MLPMGLPSHLAVGGAVIEKELAPGEGRSSCAVKNLVPARKFRVHAPRISYLKATSPSRKTTFATCPVFSYSMIGLKKDRSVRSSTLMGFFASRSTFRWQIAQG